MVQKRSLLDALPAASSEEEESTDASEDEKEQEPKSKSKSTAESEDDDDGEEEESEESDDEEEEQKEKSVPITPHVEKKPAVQKTTATAAPTKPQSSSESDADEGSGSESDSGDTQQSPTASAFTIKPILSKPMTDSDPKKPAPKSTGRSSSTPSKPTGKRPAETQQNGKDSSGKKSKVSSKDEEDGKTEEKKSAITRLWTDKDEIAVLNGMIRYKSEKGSDPLTDLVAFHEFVKDSIRADISKNQLSDKIRRLKKKYQTNAEKGENGEDPVLSRPHEYKTFELSKKIWGSASTITNAGDNNGTGNNSTSRKSKKIEPKEEPKAIVAVAEQVKDEPMAGEKDFCSVYPRLYEMFNVQNPFFEDPRRFLKENISLIGSSKAKELDDKWKNLQVEEFEVYSKRMELISEQSKLVLDAVKSSKN